MPAALKPRTIADALRRAAIAKLRDARIESAEADARLLIGHATGRDMAALLANSHDALTDEEAAACERAIARRVRGEPVARILGEKEFWSLPFKLGRDTLVPRPETETVVETALAAFPDVNGAIRVLDLGAGSGAILAAILLERPRAYGVAIDRSEGALAVARENLHRLEIGDRATYICGNWADAIGGLFDLIVANPPYIATAELALLSPEVRDHDPQLALDGGPDGLDAYRAIVNQIGELLSADGVAVLELGQGQEVSVGALVRETGRLTVRGPARRDLSGMPRALVVQRS